MATIETAVILVALALAALCVLIVALCTALIVTA